MNILLTGGSGFLGKNIIENLSGKYNILAPRHNELELLDTDAVYKYLRRASIDVIIHSAVRPGHRNSKNPDNQLYANTKMFFNLARNEDYFGKMIFLGSGAVYNQKNDIACVAESDFDKTIPEDEHGFSKYIIDKYIAGKKNIVDLRIFGIYGKYEDYSIRFISNAICKALYGLPITIKQNRRFSYLWCEDLMPILEYFITNVFEESAYNIVSNDIVELKQLAEMIRKVSGSDAPIVVANDGMGLEYSGTNKLLCDTIKGLRFTSHEFAIKKLFDWYKVNLENIDKEALLYDK